MAETKNQKFVRLAKNRVNQTLDNIRKISNLNAPSYQSSLQERKEIVQALRNAIEELEVIFGGEKSDKKVFTFGGAEESAEE